jgi:peptide/nickel transport system ATP-binding protein
VTIDQLSSRPAVPPLIEVEDLRVRFPTGRGVVEAVNGISFSIRPGERLAIVGESGSGKTVTALSLMGLVPHPGRVSGSVRLKGDELVGAGERALSRFRGGTIGLVPQDPTAALDPLKTIGFHIEQSLRLHAKLGRREARASALDLLRQVHIGDPEARMRQYGHELSGGMAQRAVIASVIAPEPELLVADEPTSALDATTADGILELIGGLNRDRGLAVLMITHDLGVVARFAERVIVVYAGRIVEEGSVEDVFTWPKHPYTRGLLDSVPGALGRRAVGAIPGAVPDLTSLPSGCAFHPRCFLSGGRTRCRDEAPPLVARDGALHRSACHFAEELKPRELAGAIAETKPAEQRTASPGGELVALDGVSKSFAVKGHAFREGGEVRAVDGVSLGIRPGEVLALVGESGSGKTTTGKLILGLESPSAGQICFDGREIPVGERRPKELQRRMQVVFQNPDSSLNPRMRVEDIIAEPLKVHGIGTAAERRERVVELLEHVGLSAQHVGRYPFEFSGGQRQRIAIARALAPRPDFIVCDEPVTALDVSIQAQILDLLQRIQRDEGLAYLFIAHDLSVVRQLADRVAVMYCGHVVEVADADAFFLQPHHPYSVALLSAMSSSHLEVERRRERIVLSGSIPSPLAPPPACRFHTRCWKAESLCREVKPELARIGDGGMAACHFPEIGDRSSVSDVILNDEAAI